MLHSYIVSLPCQVVLRCTFSRSSEKSMCVGYSHGLLLYAVWLTRLERVCTLYTDA